MSIEYRWYSVEYRWDGPERLYPALWTRRGINDDGFYRYELTAEQAREVVEEMRDLARTTEPELELRIFRHTVELICAEEIL